MTSNPYAPPTSTNSSVAISPNKPVEWRRGPVWYIVFAGLIGGFTAMPFLAEPNVMAFATIPVGCIFGGIVFRLRSRGWPCDSSVRRQQLIYSILAVFVLPPILFFLVGSSGASRSVMTIGTIVGASVACGIVVSGTRRFKETAAEVETEPITDKQGPSVRIGIILCVVLTMLYWTWESRAGGNIRVDLLLIYPLLFGSYLYALQRLGWLSAVITVALMFANTCFFAASYSLFGKPLG